MFHDPSKTNLSPSDQELVEALNVRLTALERLNGDDAELARANDEARVQLALEREQQLSSWQSTLGAAGQAIGEDVGAVVERAVAAVLARFGVPVPPTTDAPTPWLGEAPVSPAPPSPTPVESIPTTPDPFTTPKRAGGA